VEYQQEQNRLPRFQRHRFRKPTLELQERDREIIRLVADCRVISSEEIQALIPGSAQSILRRLQKLYHGGFLDRPRHQKLRPNRKMIYALGQRGVHMLAQATGGEGIGRQDLSERTSSLTTVTDLSVFPSVPMRCLCST
jgi:Replication-relaxation